MSALPELPYVGEITKALKDAPKEIQQSDRGCG